MQHLTKQLADALRRLAPATETLREIARANPESESALALIQAHEALAACPRWLHDELCDDCAAGYAEANPNHSPQD